MVFTVQARNITTESRNIHQQLKYKVSLKKKMAELTTAQIT